MRVGLIDVDGHNFPNIPLMKISAFHKSQGDSVSWYDPMFGGHYDRVYMSKVFSFTPDYEYYIDSDEVIKGGSGYAIEFDEGKESYRKELDNDLNQEIEHIYPDYDLYGITDTEYGFMTRGCPRGCDFCHVASKEGRCSVKVSDLYEFWRGQKNIVLCDPNILACKDWRNLLSQLIQSNASIDFNQGLDIRMIDDEKIDYLNKINIKSLHFAFDRYIDKDIVLPKFKLFAEKIRIRTRDISVYVLCGFDSTIREDLFRIMELRKLGYSPYVMLYNKDNIPKHNILRKLQRWVNNRFVFWSVNTFDEYLNGRKE